MGGRAVGPWLANLKTKGQIASTQTPNLDLNYLLDANITFHGILLTHNGTRTRKLIGLLNSSKLVSVVSHVLPLSRAVEAHRILEERHAGGKVVLVTHS